MATMVERPATELAIVELSLRTLDTLLRVQFAEEILDTLSGRLVPAPRENLAGAMGCGR